MTGFVVRRDGGIPPQTKKTLKYGGGAPTQVPKPKIPLHSGVEFQCRMNIQDDCIKLYCL